MQGSLKKMVDIQQKIEALKGEQLKIEQAVSLEILDVLKKQGAFGVDFDALLGGMLYVINTIQSDSKESEGWRQAGQKFRGGAKTKSNKMAKAKPEMA